MFRPTTLINLGLGLTAAAVMISVVVVKSAIANDVKVRRALEADLEAAYARQDALQADWARLQHRSNIRALGQTHFGNGVSELAEEVHIRDLPRRDTGGDGHQAALALFARAITNSAEREGPDASHLPASVLDPDLIATLISRELAQ